MADRNVKVTVRADVADFKRGMDEAGRSAEQLGTKATESATKAKTGLSGMAQHVRDNREAWTTTGTALTAYGAAVTGIGVAVLKTGISYNTLRQTSVAALTTLTGSAEAANAQMDKLDDFASNSPFARDVFINAQRQLIGFGFEAEKVVPILDAVQNAVAATGGSNQDIAELVRIIAQVGAAGKISAVDLMQFGQRGVDAATLIGSQMGKTGAQIREDITDGALGADEAIAALVAGMDQRFGGAAANVKGTFLGSLDRVKAAFRDVSASAASILVDPQGGGLLVDGFNRLADAMRAFEDIPGPIRNTVLAMGGLSGVASLAVGSFMLLAPRMVDTWDAMGKMGTFGTTAQTGLRNVGSMAARVAGPLMLGALLVTLSKVGQSMMDTGESSEVLENRLRRLGGSGDVDLSGLLQGADGISDFNAELERLANPDVWKRIGRGITDTGDGILGFVTAGHDGRTEATQFRHALGDLDPVLANLAATSREDASEAFMGLTEQMGLNRRGVSNLIELMPGYRDHLVGIATEMGLSADRATLLAIATGEIGPNAEAAADGTEGLAGAAADAAAEMEEAAEAAEKLAEGYAQWLQEVGTAASAFASVEGALKQHQAATQEWAQEQADATKSSKDSWEDFYDGTSVNLAKYLDELQSMIDAQTDWQENIESLVGRVSQATLDHLMRLGPEGAPLVAALVDGTADELARFDQLFAESGVGAGMAWAAGIREAQAVFNAAARQLGTDAAVEIVDAIMGGELTAAQAVMQYDLQAEVMVAANDDQAAADVMALVQDIEATTAIASVNADLGLAIGGVNKWVYDTNSMRPMPLVNANTRPADNETAAWKSRTDRTTGTASIAGNASGFHGTLAAALQTARNSSATVSIYAQLRTNINAMVRAATSPFTLGLGRADGGAITRASGGPVHGPGGPTDDLVAAYNANTGQPYRLSNNEHIWTAAETAAVGGHEEMYRLRKAALSGAVRFDIGGQVAAAYASRQQSWAAPHVTAPVMQAGASHSGPVVATVDPQSIRDAFQGVTVVTRIGGREFYGVMRETQDRYEGRTAPTGGPR